MRYNIKNVSEVHMIFKTIIDPKQACLINRLYFNTAGNAIFFLEGFANSTFIFCSI